MQTGKIDIQIGHLSFQGEGDQEWLEKLFDKLLSKASSISPPATPEDKQHKSNPSGKADGAMVSTLATFLKDKSAATNQNKKFLATAVWLRLKGNSRPSTSHVTGTLSENHQTRLGNASQCLNNNVGKGFCQKDGNQFYVTDEGLKEIGVSLE